MKVVMSNLKLSKSCMHACPLQQNIELATTFRQQQKSCC